MNGAYNGVMSTYYAEKFYTTGKRVRARLTALGITQTDLYDDMRRRGAKVSKSFISQVVNDNKGMSIENLVPLAKALDTTTDHLLLIRDDPEPYRETEPTYYSEEADQVARIVDEMPPVMRTAMVRMLSTVLDVHA